MERFMVDALIGAVVSTVLTVVLTHFLTMAERKKQDDRYFKQEERMNRQEEKMLKQENASSYYQPLAMNLSHQSFESRVPDGNTFIVENVPIYEARFYQGFPIHVKTLWLSEEDPIGFTADIQYGPQELLKLQEQKGTQDIHLTIQAPFGITDKSEHYLYSGNYFLFTDFLGNHTTYLSFLVMEYPDGPTGQAKMVQTFLFDQTYTLLGNYDMVLNQITQDEHRRQEVQEILSSYLTSYAKLLAQL